MKTKKYNQVRNAFALFFFLLSVVVFSQPTDNPYKTKYGTTNHWTDQIKWSNVFDATVHNVKTSNSAAVNSSSLATLITTVTNAGGGVIYFPAGTYNFAESIILKDGVVLRGANVTGNATSSGFDPSTNFVFPLKGWKRVGEDFKVKSKNMGIVSIDIDKAHILFTGSGWKQYSTSVDPNHKYATILDENILIMNVRINNTGVPQPGLYNANGWCYRFGSHINLYVKANGVVVNCRCGDNTTDDFNDFNHLNHYGIVINRQKLAIDTPCYTSGPNFNYGIFGYLNNANYTDDPTLFYSGNEIKDCYSKTTMRVKIIASGTGLVLENNVTDDVSGKVCKWDPDGKKVPGNSATFENRGIDFSGTHLVIRNNIAKCYKCLINTGPYYSVDGEGLLAQECCGGSVVNDYLIENNELQGDAGYIGLWKMKDIDNVLIRNNKLNNKPIYVTANTNTATYRYNHVVIDGNTGVNAINTNGTKGGDPCTSFIQNNKGTGNITFPCHVTVQNNTGLSENSCTAVTSSSEPALELTSPLVDQKIIDCAAKTISFEATVACGSFTSVEFINNGVEVLGNGVKNGSKYTYTVNLGSGAMVKNISARGKWSGTSKVTKVIQINKVCDIPTSNENRFNLDLTIYPNPSSDKINISNDNISLKGAVVLLIDVLGKVIIKDKIEDENLKSIDIRNIPDGIYFIQVTKENAIYSKNICIRKN